MYAQDGDLEHIFGDVAKILQHEIFQNSVLFLLYKKSYKCNEYECIFTYWKLE